MCLVVEGINSGAPCGRVLSELLRGLFDLGVVLKSVRRKDLQAKQPKIVNNFRGQRLPGSVMYSTSSMRQGPVAQRPFQAAHI